jgi:hypothetical protein
MYAATRVNLDSLTSVATLARGGRCILAAVRAINTVAAASYTQLFDAAAAADVTVGTTIPTWVLKAQSSDPSDGDGLPTMGVVFTLGIVAASTTTATGSTSVTQHVRICII